MKKYFQQISQQFSKNSTRIYLVLANVVLTCFAIWFSNVGLLPFKNLGDFAFFVILALMFALYRPGWAFVLFIGSLALENINLAPSSIGISLRPYQLFGALTLLAVALRHLIGRRVVTLFKLKWYDALPILFVLSGFLSGLGAANRGLSLKQALIAASFVALYFLVRVYVQSFADLGKIALFFLSSGVVVVCYSIWQNIRFSSGFKSFETMPGRPNGTFSEPDWLGIYLTFLLASLLVWLFYVSKNHNEKESRLILNFKFEILNQFFNVQIFKKVVVYIFITLVTIALILTVSRSAWIGAVLIALGFLKIVLLYGEKESQVTGRSGKFWQSVMFDLKRPWNWKGFSKSSGFLVGIFAISVGAIFVFHLTTFQLGSRVQSTGGLQKITIACQGGLDVAVPQKINNVEELANYQCWHINLEDIEKEKKLGSIVQEVYRSDPNVGIRGKIYRTAFEQIKKHPIVGIGWGSVSTILGTDERGTGLNASNIFLDSWLGAGLLGLLAFSVLLGYVFVFAYLKFVKSQGTEIASTFVIFGVFAIFVPNLFNSGIFLGFVWVFLAIAVSLLADTK
ncbi:MAG: hypothetical protein HGA61_04960 [Candidatus Moranbacteria bacterium]|nr:hypothetical protein [Candidatus Moranbacteria bacterium]